MLANIKAITGDLGRSFEMGICAAYNIKYNNCVPNIDNEDFALFKDQLLRLRSKIHITRYIGQNKNRYDFETTTGYLSVKTNKSGQYVCPQVIGQPTVKSFNNYFNAELRTNEDIKSYICQNIHALCYEYFDNTFEVPLIYYNRQKKTMKLIRMKKQIDWDKLAFEFTLNHNEWTKSTTLKLKDFKAIGTIQLPSQFTRRSAVIKFRWCILNVCDIFEDNFIIDEI